MKTQLVLSNELTTVPDRLSEPYHFVNNLAMPLDLEDPIMVNSVKERRMVKSPYAMKLETLSVEPWPNQTFLVCCNLCPQAYVGHHFKRILSVGSAYPNSFSQPVLEPHSGGRFKEIEISLHPMKGQSFDMLNNIQTVTVQISIVKQM